MKTLAVSLLLMLAVAASACRGPVTSPDRLKAALDTLQSVAKDAAPLVSAADYQKVHAYHDMAVALIGSAGWQGKALAGLDDLKATLPAAEFARLAPYVDLARALIESQQ